MPDNLGEEGQKQTGWVGGGVAGLSSSKQTPCWYLDYTIPDCLKIFPVHYFSISPIIKILYL
jgi:hypothetical protein